MSTHEGTAVANAHQNMRSVTIRVFCPTDHTPYELREVPVSLTIADLRTRLAQAIPSHPAPASLRLFFLGRRLTDDNVTIAELIPNMVGESFTFHLLLPMEASSVVPSSISRTSSLAPLNPLSPATGVPLSSDPSSQRLLPIGGNNPLHPSTEIVQRRIEAINRQLRGMSTDTRDIADLRRRVPAWQAAHMHDPTPASATGNAQMNSAVGSAVADTNLSTTSLPTSTIAQGGLTAQGPGPAFAFATLTRRMYSAVDPNGQGYLLVRGEFSAIVPTANNAIPAATPSAVPNVRPATRAAQEPVGVAAVPDNGLRQLLAEAANRRLWLFARLWLMSYLLSPWGAWVRVLFVFVSAVASLLFELQRPRWLWETVVRPIRRHLEDLAHMGGPRQAAAGQHDGENRGERHGRSEVWDTLRRAERAIVLLLASLIPGVGERQVEARNAAEAERARQEGQERARAEDGSEADGAEQSQAQQVAPEDQQEGS